MSKELAKLDTPDAQVALATAIQVWASATTDPTSARYTDLIRDKVRAVTDFVNYVKMHPAQAGDGEVYQWRQDLERRGLVPTTVYAMVSRLSSFYKWAMRSPLGRELFTYNPVMLARPKAPTPFQGETVKALRPEDTRALFTVVRGKARAGDVAALRDYAILLFFFATGWRRSSIIGLHWGDTHQGDTNTITARLKGGKVKTKEVKDERPWDALFAYLEASGRLETMTDDKPLWARHDPHAPGMHAPLSAWGFVKNLKAYSEKAGIGHVWLHRTRHTFAQDVYEAEGMGAAQEALDHSNPNTTNVYVTRLAVQKDRHSTRVLDHVLPD
jgi:integrase